jgi:thiamine kinase-like enzyme
LKRPFCFSLWPYNTESDEIQILVHPDIFHSAKHPGASKLSFVGLMEPAGFDKDKPVPLDWDYAAMRKAVFDLDTGWTALVREVQEDCAIM